MGGELLAFCVMSCVIVLCIFVSCKDYSLIVN